ncbi:MAG: hypothetical protein LBQ66_05490 [Planctomycetaceae bacterium]|nr:hypothetical protein [Planctomycetaceae bacterium]
MFVVGAAGKMFWFAGVAVMCEVLSFFKLFGYPPIWSCLFCGFGLSNGEAELEELMSCAEVGEFGVVVRLGYCGVEYDCAEMESQIICDHSTTKQAKNIINIIFRIRNFHVYTETGIGGRLRPHNGYCQMSPLRRNTHLVIQNSLSLSNIHYTTARIHIHNIP